MAPQGGLWWQRVLTHRNLWACGANSNTLVSDTMETHSPQELPPTEKMGPRIRRLRKRLGLTQTELGERVGVRELAVGDWEREKYAPKGENLVALADALGVAPHYIVYGEAGIYREAIEQIAEIVDRVRATQPPSGQVGLPVGGTTAEYVVRRGSRRKRGAGGGGE